VTATATQPKAEHQPIIATVIAIKKQIDETLCLNVRELVSPASMGMMLGALFIVMFLPAVLRQSRLSRRPSRALENRTRDFHALGSQTKGREQAHTAKQRYQIERVNISLRLFGRGLQNRCDDRIHGCSPGFHAIDLTTDSFQRDFVPAMKRLLGNSSARSRRNGHPLCRAARTISLGSAPLEPGILNCSGYQEREHDHPHGESRGNTPKQAPVVGGWKCG
jgi:hypothetical protein